VVDGDPVANISDIRKVRTVIKDGVLLDAAALYSAVGREAGAVTHGVWRRRALSARRPVCADEQRSAAAARMLRH
jgi:hypothetical protein